MHAKHYINSKLSEAIIALFWLSSRVRIALFLKFNVGCTWFQRVYYPRHCGLNSYTTQALLCLCCSNTWVNGGGRTIQIGKQLHHLLWNGAIMTGRNTTGVYHRNLHATKTCTDSAQQHLDILKLQPEVHMCMLDTRGPSMRCHGCLQDTKPDALYSQSTVQFCTWMGGYYS